MAKIQRVASRPRKVRVAAAEVGVGLMLDGKKFRFGEEGGKMWSRTRPVVSREQRTNAGEIWTAAAEKVPLERGEMQVPVKEIQSSAHFLCSACSHCQIPELVTPREVPFAAHRLLVAHKTQLLAVCPKVEARIVHLAKMQTDVHPPNAMALLQSIVWSGGRRENQRLR